MLRLHFFGFPLKTRGNDKNTNHVILNEVKNLSAKQ